MNLFAKIGLTSILLFIIGAELLYLTKSKASEANLPTYDQSGDGRLNPVAEKKRWTERIQEAGPEIAYREFSEAYADKHFGIQHGAMHIMGELLYETQGIKGLSICDVTFAFGCYHSFFGRAFSEKGLEIIRDLDHACVAKFGPLGTGCQHGIGHGLMEYFGAAKLTTALEHCKETTQLKELFGCTSGVFMEYNVPIIIDANISYTEPRKLNSANPNEPCNTIVAEKFRSSCYYEMPQWWDKVYKRNYEKIGMLCNDIENVEHQESCFLGIGNVAAPSSEYDVKETIAKCEKMPDSKSMLICRSGSSWSFFSNPNYRKLAPQICASLNEEEKSRCAKKSDLIGNNEINA